MYIAIYCRVSTERQINDGFGLDIQKREMIEEATKHKFNYKEYVDYGITGTSIDKRTALKEILEDIKSGKISEVWVTKLSRLGRNTRDVLNIIHELERYNVTFRSLRDGIDTSNSMGKVMLQFMSIVSEMERDIIIETTKAGLDYRASLGKIYGCAPVLGYDRIGSGKTSYLEVNEDEAKIVKLIFSLYIKGYGYKAITNQLNAKGYTSKRGNYFSINTVKNCLSNPLYVGKIRYNLFKDWTKKRRKGIQSKKDIILVDGLHKSIISKAKWNKTQKLMSVHKSRKRIQSPHYLLAGILRCPDCSSLMTGVKGSYVSKKEKRVYRYYVCSNYHNKGRHVCKSNSVNANELDKKSFGLIMSTFEYLKKNHSSSIINKIYEDLESQNRTKIKELIRKLVKSIEINHKNKSITYITYKTEESLFEYLGVKYSANREKELKSILSCIDF